MINVNSLVNIAVFGIGGAIIMAALIGLLLVASGSARGASPRARLAFGCASIVLLVSLPSLAATNALATGAAFGTAFVTATCVVAIVYAVNIALLPVVARRQAAADGQTALSGLRPSLPVLAAGLGVCLLLGLLGSVVGLFVA
ncbi:hypothetical protein [Nocardiopsis kunsanensis]|uniref:Uncharacterized protein n=1 Tax=Nocardiopsis kunsanensis TaxID=141693 RepID=A0A918X5P8_9ACTN|nr:hypothetical protein [Nocardiopsis kunsanensis]GHD14224.1 hypothetical protein GCM10007147_00060 [Nocardiopsis kunsanensis]